MRASLALLLCLCCAALTHCQRRRIDKLPRLNFQPNFAQYSGYLTSIDDRRLFYWLVESSQVTPADAPLVLWLNGGPGCSSVGGLLMTNGPFLANDRAELDRNELAWNRLANVLYIDSPNGVGLSEPGPINKSVLNDQFTTELNLRALVDFYRLFPEFKGRPFYIAGESYAGIYIPLLGHAILRSNQFPNIINLKGIAVGNGLHVPWKIVETFKRPFASAAGLYFAGLVLSLPDVNIYNIEKPCHFEGFDAESYSCLNSTGLVAYLNDRDVRAALGITNRSPRRYAICSNAISDAYERTSTGVSHEIMDLIGGSVSVLLYHGTLDLILPIGATQAMLRSLRPRLTLDRAESGAWHYCSWESTTGEEVLRTGGLQASYMGGLLRYRTVIGAGRSVPTDRPDMGFQILADFLQPWRGRRQLRACRRN